MTEPTTSPPALPEVAERSESPLLPLVRLLPAPPPPEGAILIPPEHRDPPRRGWLLVELWAEVQLALRMYFDPRYRLSRVAQIALPLFFVLLALNYLVFSVWISILVVSPVVETLIAVLIGVLAYRVMLRELDRYRAVLDYLSRYGRQ